MLTSILIQLVDWVLVSFEHPNEDNIIAIFQKFLYLFDSLYLFGWRTSLFYHVINNSY